MTPDHLRQPAAALGRDIETGKIDAVDLATAYLEAVDASGDGPAVYARMTAERALAEAKAAADRAQRGLRRGPLDGVPISWKDLFDTAGTGTEAGSAFLKGRIPQKDALVVARASEAGLVCLGKTHMTELAFSGLGLNPVTATPPNSIAPDLAPGGSSSGAAVSVGLEMAAAGIGSDTGGSVRIPAAWNNLVGLKTTHGLLPLDGVVPLCPLFDTIGPLCRTVEDASLLLSVMDGTEPTSLDGADVAGMRFAVCETRAFDECATSVLNGFDDASKRLAAKGALVEVIAIDDVASALDLSAVLFASEAYATWRTEIEAAPEVMFELVRNRFRSGRDYSASDYVRAWQDLNRLRKAITDKIASFDAIIIPTSPTLPPDREALLADHAYFGAQNLLALRNTRICNLLGGAAITIPTGQDHVGIMAIGPAGSDRKILRVGAAIEKALA